MVFSISAGVIDLDVTPQGRGQLGKPRLRQIEQELRSRHRRGPVSLSDPGKRPRSLRREQLVGTDQHVVRSERLDPVFFQDGRGEIAAVLRDDDLRRGTSIERPLSRFMRWLPTCGLSGASIQ
jgi:hypothetical protein